MSAPETIESLFESALLQEDLETGMFSTDGVEMVVIIVWSELGCWTGIRIRKM